jgi:hypothetical protein
VTSSTERIRLTIYRQFAAAGHAPSRGEVATATGLGEAEVSSAFEQLSAQRHIVLGDDGEIVTAHPFASINLGFSVMGERTLWWGGCAWDSFAIPRLVPGEPSVHTPRARSGEGVLRQRRPFRSVLGLAGLRLL